MKRPTFSSFAHLTNSGENRPHASKWIHISSSVFCELQGQRNNFSYKAGWVDGNPNVAEDADVEEDEEEAEQ